jgi:hypothetical protein
MVYLLAGAQYYMEDLRTAHGHQDTEASEQFLRNRRAIGRDIDLEFLPAPSVSCNGSKAANFEFPQKGSAWIPSPQLHTNWLLHLPDPVQVPSQAIL